MRFEVRDGLFRYPGGERIVLDHISLSLEPGSVLAILGPNGAGKTTLLRCMLGFLKWDEGCSVVDGTPVGQMSPKKFWKRVSYVPQIRQAPAAYTVEEMILLGRAGEVGSFSSPKERDLAAADAAIKQTNLESIRHCSCARLSGGEYQMVLIARALASEPEMIVMDEPESNLDFRNQLLVLDLISQLSHEGMICVFNTHYPAHALRWAGKALMLSKDGGYRFGDSRRIVTEKSISECFGVSAIIGSLETGGGTYPDVIPVGIEDAGVPPVQGDDNVIAGISILLENTENAGLLNRVLHEYADCLIGRMGVPCRPADVHVISIMLDAPLFRILSLSDRLSAIPGVHVKTTYVSAGGNNGKQNADRQAEP